MYTQFTELYRYSCTISPNCHTIIFVNLHKKHPKNTPNFRHIAQRTSVHPFVHIVQWSGISHFCVQLPLKTVQRAHFLLNSIQIFQWNHDFIGIFTSYKLQKCEKYNLPQIHHIRTYYNSKVLWCVFILNCVYTGDNLMNCIYN